MDTSARGLVAIGYVPFAKAGVQQPPAAWHAPDGAVWASSTFKPSPPKTSFETIGSGVRGVYAAGSDANGRSTGWRSADGSTWTADPSPPPGHLVSIVATADGFLAVGDDEQGRIAAAVWIAH